MKTNNIGPIGCGLVLVSLNFKVRWFVYRYGGGMASIPLLALARVTMIAHSRDPSVAICKGQKFLTQLLQQSTTGTNSSAKNQLNMVGSEIGCMFV